MNSPGCNPGIREISGYQAMAQEVHLENKVYCQRNGKYDKGFGRALGASIVDFLMSFFDKKEQKNQDATCPASWPLAKSVH